jgi:hypothetical protein
MIYIRTNAIISSILYFSTLVVLPGRAGGCCARVVGVGVGVGERGRYDINN